MKHFYFPKDSHFSSLRRQLHLGSLLVHFKQKLLVSFEKIRKRQNKEVCKRTHNLSRFSFNLCQLVDYWCLTLSGSKNSLPKSPNIMNLKLGLSVQVSKCPSVQA